VDIIRAVDSSHEYNLIACSVSVWTTVNTSETGEAVEVRNQRQER